MLAIIFLGLAAPTLPAQHPDQAKNERAAWTKSRFQGTPEPPPAYRVEPAFPGIKLNSPVALAQPEGSHRIFVAELNGKLVAFPNDAMANTADVVIDLKQARPGFGQFYGLAFHPQFAKNRQVFLCYTFAGDKPDGTVVARFTLSDTNPPRIDIQSEQVIIRWLSGGHNGGCLQFGPDGYLYISTGDAAVPTPPDILDTGQNIKDLLSSILRIDVDSPADGRPYRIPTDNPFLDVPGARPEVWAYGLRNPWRMSFDKTTGDLWVGDVGWELWEMIYKVKRGGNYGWSVTEGPQSVRPEATRGPTPILPPTATHPHSEAASITGGYVYRGTRLKELEGTYIYGDYQSGKVWGLKSKGEEPASPVQLAETGLRLVSFGTDAHDELYLLEMERSNQIYKLMPNPVENSAAQFPRKLSDTGLFSSTLTQTPSEGVFPYQIHAEPWSDGVWGTRFVGLPTTAKITTDREGRWKMPEGTVLAKTTWIDLKAGDPTTRKRLETQVLHLEQGSWRPYTYLWNDDQSDAQLADPNGASIALKVIDPNIPGGERAINYRVPARAECVLCHNPWVEAKTTVFGRQSASPLGFIRPQLDRTVNGENQITSLEQRSILETSRSTQPAVFANPYDETLPLDARARTYLHVNCSHCHQFNAGGTATIALAYNTDLDKTNTLTAVPTQGLFGIEQGKIITPGEPERSLLYYRIAKSGPGRMPRIGSDHVDAKAAKLIGDWIAAMPNAKPGTSSDTSERKTAIDSALANTRNALLLIRAGDRGEISGNVLAEVAKQARTRPQGEIADLFDRFLSDTDRVKRLGDHFTTASVLGLKADAERGRQLFLAESGTACKTCHSIPGGPNSLVGPDLKSIGSKYSKPDLLKHITQPSLEIAPAYLTRVVTTKDGLTHIGQVAEQTPDTLTLRDARGALEKIALAEVEDNLPQAKSLMPEGLFRDLTPQQAADLIEFLSTLKQ